MIEEGRHNRKEKEEGRKSGEEKRKKRGRSREIGEKGSGAQKMRV